MKLAKMNGKTITAERLDDQTELQLWVPCKKIFTCPECQGKSLEQVEEFSILDTFRCAQGHIWYRMRDDSSSGVPGLGAVVRQQDVGIGDQVQKPGRDPIKRRRVTGSGVMRYS